MKNGYVFGAVLSHILPCVPDGKIRPIPTLLSDRFSFLAAGHLLSVLLCPQNLLGSFLFLYTCCLASLPWKAPRYWSPFIGCVLSLREQNWGQCLQDTDHSHRPLGNLEKD